MVCPAGNPAGQTICPKSIKGLVCKRFAGKEGQYVNTCF